jgi:hypothetical protein
MSKTEAVGGIERRRKFTDEQKAVLVAERTRTSSDFCPGTSLVNKESESFFLIEFT